MTPVELIASLTRHGLTPMLDDGGELVLEAEDGCRMNDAERAALKVEKAGVVALLKAAKAPVGDWSRVKLTDLRAVLEISIPGVDMPVLLAPGCRLARELRAQQHGRAIVVCVCSAIDMLLAGLSANDARAALQVAPQFDGEVVGVLPHAGRTTGARPC